MPGSKLNIDIQDERERVAFDVEEFTNWYYGGKEKVEEKRFLGKSKHIYSFDNV